MARDHEGLSPEVVYPTACKGKCRLGLPALQLVDGVLSRKCRGPVRSAPETVAMAIDGSGETGIVPMAASDLARRSCTNPRVIEAVRRLAFDSAGSMTVDG